MTPQPDKTYIAKGEYFALLAITEAAAHKTATPRTWGGAWHTDGCSGLRLPISTNDDDGFPWEFLVANPPDRRRHPETWRREAVRGATCSRRAS